MMKQAEMVLAAAAIAFTVAIGVSELVTWLRRRQKSRRNDDVGS